VANLVQGDLVVTGNLIPGGLQAPAGSVSASNIGSPAAGQPGIASSKLNHREHHFYNQPNTTIVAATVPIFITYGTAGTVVSFKAGSIAVCTGAATVTVDLYKNGSSILSAPIALNSSSVARVAQAATISTPATAVGDWFDIVVTATAGGGTIGTGLYVEAIIDENPS
jgi:hypothetical protein